MYKSLKGLLFDKFFLTYALIGVSGVLIDFLIYIGLVQLNIPPFLASMVSVSMGIINNFFWNLRFNFKRKDHLLTRFVSFYLVGATGVILSALIIILLHNIIGINDLVAKAVSVPFIVILQFWLNKNVSFAKSKVQIPWKTMSIVGVIITVITLFAVNAPYFNFFDENDNLLGAQLIVQEGATIYKDYFSHHMPLQYFTTVPLLFLFGTNLIAVKVVFSIAMSIWLLAMSRHLLRHFGLMIFVLFTLLIAISQTLSWSHMILAETFIAFAVTHALILFLTHKKRKPISYKEIVVFCILGSIPALSALPYLPLSLLIYSLLLFILVNHRRLSLKVIMFSSFIASLPYVALLIYLAINHAVSEFREQAVNFNTLYYSQFTPHAPRTSIEALLAIPANALESLRLALLDFSLIGQPLPFLFAFAIIISILYLINYRQYLIATLFSLSIFLAASRGGFTGVFSNGNGSGTRAGISITFLGLLLIIFCLTHYYCRKKDERKDNSLINNTFIIGSTVTLSVIALSSLSNLFQTTREYTLNRATITAKEEPNSPSTVINIVNDASDKYWVGPIDFSSQLIIKSKNVSIYRFYLPWHSVCPECTNQLISDIRDRQPKVIAFDQDASIWGYKVSDYAQPLIQSFEDNYYQLPDKRLNHFYFLKSKKGEINDKLFKAGYQL